MNVPFPRGLVASSFLLAAGALASCGAGTAGIVAGTGGSDSGGNAPTVLGDVMVSRAKTSPARITFRLTDAEGDRAEVEIRVRTPGGAALNALLVASPAEGVDTVLEGLRADADGEEHVKLWDFAAQLGGGFVPGVEIDVRLGASGSFVPVGRGVGNDPPALSLAEPPPSEDVVGLAQIRLRVADSSGDIVDVAARYSTDSAGGFPEGSFQPASPADEGLVGVVTDDGGAPDGVASADFFWNVVRDLGTTEHRVRLRFVPTDRDEDGSSLASGEPLELELTVDNNAEPIADLDETSFVLNSDRRRGLPVPFRVIDQEPGEVVDVVFQWRHPEQSFDAPPLALPASAAEIRELLRSPERRRQHQIAEQMPVAHGGTLQPLDDDTVRLPELALGESSLEARGLVGRTLQVLRASAAPEVVSGAWASAPSRPAAAIPDETGARAFVLDRASPGSLRLTLRELATGAVLEALVDGVPGIPDALAWEVGGGALLLASHDLAGERWKLARLASPGSGAALETLGEFSAASSLVDPDSGSLVRGLASIGERSVVATLGSELVRVDYDAPPATSRTVLGGLAEPVGVAVDLRQPQQVFVAERAGGRVLAVDPESGTARIVAASLSSSPPFVPGGFPAPEAIAFDPVRRLLWVVTDPLAGDGSREVRGVALTGGNPQVFALGAVPTDTPASGEIVGTSLAVAESGTLVLTARLEDRVAAGGGVEQERLVIAADGAANSVTVDRPFEPPLASARRWRVEERVAGLVAGPAGARGTFLWDVSRVSADEAFLRLIPLDSERGIESDSFVSKELAPPFDPSPARIPDDAVDVAIADLDVDGALDLLLTGSLVRFHRQTTPRTFAFVEAFGPAGAAAAADVSGDGLPDVVTLDFDQVRTSINSALQPGTFTPGPSLELPFVLNLDGTVLVSDLNGDALPDLCAGGMLYFQDPFLPGSFPASPDLVLFPGSGEAAAGDIDGEGRIDLVAVSTFGDPTPAPDLFLQAAPGQFTAIDLADTSRAVSVDLADVDRDGDLDVLLAGFLFVGSSSVPDGFAVIHFQDGSGRIVASTGFGNEVMDGTRNARAADVNRDGLTDVLVFSSEFFDSEPENLVPSVLLFHQRPRQGTGVPQFRLSAQGSLALSFFGRPDAPEFLEVADVDADGLVDVVAPTSSGTFPSFSADVFFQEGAGGLLPDPDGPLRDPTTFLSSAGLGDLDGDGLLDVVASDPSLFSGRVRIFRQTTVGEFALDPLILTGGDPSFPFTPSRLSVADVSGDDRPDIVVADSGDVPSDGIRAQVRVFEQSGPGQFGQGASFAVLDVVGVIMGQFTSDVLAQDLDADGRVDLAVALFAPEAFLSFVAVQLRGSGSELALDGPTSSIAAGDLDGNGLADVVTARTASLPIYLHHSPGEIGVDPGGGPTRTPDLELRAAFLDGPSAVAVADLDGDGRLDVLAACNQSANLVLFLQRNDGDAVLEPGDFAASAVPAGGALDAMHLVDLDFDGDLDVLARRRGPASTFDVISFLGTAPGRFAPEPSSPLAQGLSGGAFAVGDIDGDRDADLLLGSGGGFRIHYGRH
jgi:hypothetical protein